ncbi:MAG: ATP-binding protein [Candidatus Acidiferrales bacterium]
MGLGLSIVAKIVYDHGGSIQLTSKPGQGACFRVFFPSAAKK